MVLHLQAGNGRDARVEVKEELPRRLVDAGVDASPERLAEALVRLADSACIQRVQRQLHPEFIVSLGMKLFDAVDAAIRGGMTGEVDPPIEVESATWSPGGQLDYWVKERQQWLGLVRGVKGRQRWIKAADLRPANSE